MKKAFLIAATILTLGISSTALLADDSTTDDNAPCVDCPADMQDSQGNDDQWTPDEPMADEPAPDDGIAQEPSDSQDSPTDEPATNGN